MLVRRATVLLVLFFAVAGCRGAPPPVPARPSKAVGLPFRSLAVVAVGPDEGLAFETCPAEGALLMAVLAGGWDFGADRPALRVGIACVTRSKPAGVDVLTSAELETAREGEPEVTFEGKGDRSCAGCSGDRDPRALLWTTARALHDAIDAAVAQQRVGSLDDSAVAAILARPAASPRGVVVAAIDEVGDRRLPLAVPALSSLLTSDDGEIVLRAVGALGRIGDPAAIRPLGRLALSPAAEVPHVAIRAIGDIGGADARRALEMIGNQSVDPVIVNEVRQILRELDRGRED